MRRLLHHAFALLVGGVVTTAASSPSPAVAAEPCCDVQISGPICLSGNGQDRVFVPPAAAHGLTGRWTFDEDMPWDSSGAGYHGMEAVASGPTMGGRGRSAFFQSTSLTVPAGEAPTVGSSRLLAASDFSYSFWVHFVEDPGKHHQGLKHCPLVRKGLDKTIDEVVEEPSYAAAPAIMIDQLTRKLHIELATDATTSTNPAADNETWTQATNGREAFDSHSRLSHGRWFHVALVRMERERTTRLYVNGILDSTVISSGHVVPNSEPLYMGGDPIVGSRCATPLYIDNVQRYNRPLTPDEIQAEAAPAFAGIEPSYVRLACVECSLEHAMQKCPAGYHVCNNLELHIAGYQVARTLGLVSSKDMRVWSHAASATSSSVGGVASQSPPMSFVQTGESSQSSRATQTADPSGSSLSANLGLGLCCMDGP
mmetsp:Transcript_26390/g.48231  ORF Transcript_26390/g.48231 Transcript_26390/m.48231 type:complete len:426 (-) Transcript_26390:36-1313(-)